MTHNALQSVMHDASTSVSNLVARDTCQPLAREMKQADPTTSEGNTRGGGDAWSLQLIRLGKMRVLVACEFSGVVAKAFRDRGHEAWSCDLRPTEQNGWHINGDVRYWLDGDRWDLLIGHPDCTHLAVSGARHFAEKKADGRQQSAIDFFMLLANADIAKIAIENPVCIMSSVWRKPDQIIQPWQFGHGETKATCLWLKGLPTLRPTNIVDGRDNRIHRMAPHPDRAKNRSRTYQGIADAMADQWGGE